jgi:hypothetical protein
MLSTAPTSPRIFHARAYQVAARGLQHREIDLRIAHHLRRARTGESPTTVRSPST